MIVIGKRDVDPTLPSHVPGVHEGNWPARGRRKALDGDGGDDAVVSGAPRRSTGIAPSIHVPIDPRMPKLTPP
jgi:hypothetical protein